MAKAVQTPGEGVAMITGSARRVGAEIARTLHEAGMRVALHYRRSADEAATLAAALNARRPGSAIALQADLCDAAAAKALVDAVVAHFGALDAVVNNASSFYPTPIETVSEAQWTDLMGSNLKAPLFIASAAAQALRARRGCIVNISDIHARHPLRRHPIYCAAKAGLEALTRALARDLGPEVRVNGVAPGAILWPERDGSEDVQAAIIDDTELKRLGAPADIAGAVLYLVRDAAYVTGQIIDVDGGRTIGP